MHNIRRGLSWYKGVYWPEEETVHMLNSPKVLWTTPAALLGETLLATARHEVLPRARLVNLVLDRLNQLASRRPQVRCPERNGILRALVIDICNTLCPRLEICQVL